MASAQQPEAHEAHAATAPTLDKQLFQQQLVVPALRVPKQRCNELMRILRGHTLDKPKLRCIIADPQGGDQHKLLLLSHELAPDGLPEAVQAVVAAEQLEVVSHAVSLDYSHFSAEQVLKKLLPPGVDAPSSFETIGHVVHLNLREEQLPFKHIIGQVLLDKNPHVKTVVNKVGSIENEYRVFNMELLAGEARTETEVVQHGARFRLDFAKVYWNSRLEAEHQRLVARYFEAGQVVVDMMAGIGPFAIPAAQQGCKVYANDLNPDSVKYMAVNVRLNRVGTAVSVFNMDGRAFLRLLCATPGHAAAPSGTNASTAPNSAQPECPAADPAVDGANAAASQAASSAHATSTATAPTAGPSTDNDAAAQQQQNGGHKGKKGKGSKGGGQGGSVLPDVPPVPPGFSVPPGGILFQHVVMNLPASAVEFLDAFNGAFDPATWQGKLPLVHVYTFKTATQTEQDVVQRIEGYLGGPLEEAPTIHNVRDVAPNKLMLCVTFRVPEAVAFHGRQSAEGPPQEGSAPKRQKVGE